MADSYPVSSAHLQESMAKSLHDVSTIDGWESLISPAGGVGGRRPPPTAQSGGKQELIHVVMVPYPVQGQINPMLNLAKLLIATNKYPDNNIMVTIVNNKHHHDRLSQTHQQCSGKNAHNFVPSSSTSHPITKLNFAWVDNGLPPDFDYTDLTPSWTQFHLSTSNMKAPLKLLLQTSQIPVSCVLFGSFCSWAHSAASELQIPTFMFWTQSAAMFSLYYHLPLLAANGFFSNNEKVAATDDKSSENNDSSSPDIVSYIPGIPPLHRSGFPSLLQVNDVSDPYLAHVKEQFRVIDDCNGVIINSFEELERDTCQALRAELPRGTSISLVGPLLPAVFLEDEDITEGTMGLSTRGQLVMQDKSAHQCLKWLDSKPKLSVLYVSFGTIFRPSMEELEAIANGIKGSNQPFLWVIRPTSSIPNISDMLPQGFVEGTEGRGLIVPWAPQVEVLSHPSVGAFLTHCGWNSTLESLSMGMPMIAYPISTDQPTNGVFVCEVWEVGMALKVRESKVGDGNMKSVESRDVERVVRAMLQGEEGRRIRERAGELKGAARRAVLLHGGAHQAGSSSVATEKLIGDIRQFTSPTYKF